MVEHAASHPATSSLESSYLAPLIYMVRSHDEEIRRQAVCALANLSDDPLRPSVAGLRNLQERSVLCDLFEFTRPPLNLMQRKDAVLGITNLLRNQNVHAELLRESLLPDLLRLSQSSVQAAAMIGRGSKIPRRTSVAGKLDEARKRKRVPIAQWDFPSMRLIAFGLACLCANEVQTSITNAGRYI